MKKMIEKQEKINGSQTFVAKRSTQVQEDCVSRIIPNFQVLCLKQILKKGFLHLSEIFS